MHSSRTLPTSQVKGGRFAQLCAPARVFSVVLSDILGDPLDMIACRLSGGDQQHPAGEGAVLKGPADCLVWKDRLDGAFDNLPGVRTHRLSCRTSPTSCWPAGRTLWRSTSSANVCPRSRADGLRSCVLRLEFFPSCFPEMSFGLGLDGRLHSR